MTDKLHYMLPNICQDKCVMYSPSVHFRTDGIQLLLLRSYIFFMHVLHILGHAFFVLRNTDLCWRLSRKRLNWNSPAALLQKTRHNHSVHLPTSLLRLHVSFRERCRCMHTRKSYFRQAGTVGSLLYIAKPTSHMLTRSQKELQQTQNVLQSAHVRHNLPNGTWRRLALQWNV